MIKIEMIFPAVGTLDGNEIQVTEYEFENFLKHNLVWYGPLYHEIWSADGTRYFHVMMIMPNSSNYWNMTREIYEREFGTGKVTLLETECNCK
jgi:hypothetical protein